MAYIVIVNPQILSAGGTTGMAFGGVFTFTIILGKGVPWPTALGIIFWAAVIFLLISVTPIRESIAKAIPTEIRIAAAAIFIR